MLCTWSGRAGLTAGFRAHERLQLLRGPSLEQFVGPEGNNARGGTAGYHVRKRPAKRDETHDGAPTGQQNTRATSETAKFLPKTTACYSLQFGSGQLQSCGCHIWSLSHAGSVGRRQPVRRSQTQNDY
jgi:hypothetical protein